MIHLNEFSEGLMREKYYMEGENFEGMVNRLAATLSDGEDHRRALKEILLDGRYVFAGRVQSSIGNPDTDQSAINCTQSDTIKDNLTGKGGIYWRLLEAARTMSMGCGVGFDWSTIRPGDDIASGPVSFMRVYSEMCHNVSRGGKTERGAMMAMLRVDHPEIMKYITCKRPPHQADVLYELMFRFPEYADQLEGVIQKLMPLTGFNCSVYVTDEFMCAVQAGEKYKLRFGGKVYGELDAPMVWETIMRNTWEYGDPGIFFGDTANKMDNLYYLKHKIVGTNPCGEKQFRRDMSCLLGSFNMTRYVVDSVGGRYINIAQLIRDIPHIVRAMDKVIDHANYPLPAQAHAARQDRQLGIGVMGMANALESLFGHTVAYGDETYLTFQDDILTNIRDLTYQTSIELGKEKGVFPLFDQEKYPQGLFIQTLPPSIRKDIETYGLRNSHLTSIAPTGTISLSYNNVSSGVEPTFSMRQQRVIRREGVESVVDLEDYGVKYFGNRPKCAWECSIDDHLGVLIHAQRLVDSAVSKTCNIPSHTPWDQFKDVYWRAWEGQCKGITTFTTGGKKRGVLKSLDGPGCSIDPVTGAKDCS